jgi:ADP-ribosyl-[dinitrogen reductase] hydrolase
MAGASLESVMRLRQDRVIGALLGLAIGDALGMPVEGWTRERVRERYGEIDHFIGREFEDGTELQAGEFSDESETVLCIVESFTVNSGVLDADNIRARLEMLAKGESRRWMNPSTLAALETGETPARVTGDVALRGVPLGMIAAAADFDRQRLAEAARTLSSITLHGEAGASAIVYLASIVSAVIRQEVDYADLRRFALNLEADSDIHAAIRRGVSALDRGAGYEYAVEIIGFDDGAPAVIAGGLLAAAGSSGFEDGIFLAASQGGAADARAAVAGAMAGAALGTAAIPQALIDGLEGRMYLMLAAPWFHQTLQFQVRDDRLA